MTIHTHPEYEGRLEKLEEITGDHADQLRAGEVRFERIDGTLGALVKSVDRVEETIRRVGWIIVTAVLLALLGLVVNAVREHAQQATSQTQGHTP